MRRFSWLILLVFTAKAFAAGDPYIPPGSVYTYLGPTLGAQWQLPNTIFGFGEVDNNSALLLRSTSAGTATLRAGFNLAGDGGAMMYIASFAPCSLNGGNGDNGSQVKSSNGQCWLAQPSIIPYNPMQFGAAGDGTTDECLSGGFQNALNAAAQANGGPGILYLQTFRYKFVTCNPTAPDGLTLQGPYSRVGLQTNGVYTNIPGSLIFTSTHKYITGKNNGFKGIVCAASNIFDPTNASPATQFANLNNLVSQFTGTCLQLGTGTADTGSDTIVEQSQFLGFTQAVISNGNNHIQIKNNQCDSTNCWKVTDVGEHVLIENNHAWGFLIYGPISANWASYSFYAPTVTAIANNGGFCKFTVSGANNYLVGHQFVATGTSTCANNGARQTITAVSGQDITTGVSFSGTGAAGGTLAEQGVLPRRGKIDWIDQVSLPTSGCDLCGISHEFGFAWDTGVYINNSDHVKVDSVLFDNWNQAQFTGSVGIDLEGTTSSTTILTPQLSSMGWAVINNATAGLIPGNQIVHAQFSGNIQGSIKQTAGNLSVTGGTWDATQAAASFTAVGNGSSGSEILQLTSLTAPYSLAAFNSVAISGTNIQASTVINHVSGNNGNYTVTLNKTLSGNIVNGTITITNGALYNSSQLIELDNAAALTQFTIDGGSYFSNNSIVFVNSVSGAVTNSGACQITTPVAHGLSTSQIVGVYGIAGATGCNGLFKITVNSSTQFTEVGSTFGGAYTSGGTVTVEDQPLKISRVGFVTVNPSSVGSAFQNHTRPDSILNDPNYGYLPGGPLTNGQVIYDKKFQRPAWIGPSVIALPFPLGYLRARTACTGSSVFSLRKNNVEFGQATIGAGGNDATFSYSGSPGGQFDIGDEFTILGPATADATCGNLIWSVPLSP